MSACWGSGSKCTAESSIMASQCPYHDKRWRGELQYLLNKLRGKLLQNKHIRNISRPICPCRGKKGEVSTLIGERSVEELKKWLEPDGPVQSDNQLKEAYSTLCYFLDSAEKSSLDDAIRKGLLRILTVIRAASSGDFSSLEPPLSKKPTEPAVLKTEMKLPLSSSCLGVFFGSGGKNIKPLYSKQGVTIHIGSEGEKPRRRLPYGQKQYISGDSVKVSMTYLPESQKNVEALKSMLLKRAELVTKQRTKHENDVRAWSEVRVKRQAARRQQQYEKSQSTVNQTPKEAATAKFEKKIQHTKQRTSSTGSDQDPIEATGEQKGKTKQQHSKSKILSDGHCLNCLAEFRSQETNEGACKFHSGYLVPVKPGRENQGYSWSCCKKRTAAQHPTHELHVHTGCTNGRHTWRPGKQSNKGHKGGALGKGKELATDTSDFYVN